MTEPRPRPNRIAEHRRAAGLTQQELADALDTGKTQIYKLEAGARRLTVEWMTRIGRALGCPPEALLPADKPAAGAPAFDNARLHGQKLPLSFGGREFPIFGAPPASNRSGSMVKSAPAFVTETPPNLVGVTDAYGVLVFDDTMAPRYRAGDTVHVNPHIPPRPGDCVVARRHAGLATIAELVSLEAGRAVVVDYQTRRRTVIEAADLEAVHLIVGAAHGR
jgi:transcriptional regulator with XRE-family HTH domain